MSEHRIASRYAKSLLGLADEKKSLDKVMKDMEAFQSLCEENRDMVLMLRNPIIASLKKRDILKKIFDKKVDKLTMAIFEIITKKGREQYLPEIAAAFKSQYYDKKGIVESSVTTVVPLSAAVKKELNAVVEKLTGKKVVLTEQIDPELIGGLVLKIGDRQIDDSVSGKLRELRLKFTQNQYISSI